MTQPQLTIQQLEHAIRNIEKRVQAKTLECAALQQMQAAAVDVIGKLFNFRDQEKQQPVQDAAHNFLTAKFNNALVDLEELELNLKAMRQMRSGVVGASIVVPPFNSKRQ
jgi:hypothetical protein